jgi:hypothetical protein
MLKGLGHGIIAVARMKDLCKRFIEVVTAAPETSTLQEVEVRST